MSAVKVVASHTFRAELTEALLGVLQFAGDKTSEENGPLWNETPRPRWSPDQPILLVLSPRIGSPFSGLRKQGERTV